MEFEYDEDLMAVSELAGQIFATRGEVTHLRQIEVDGGFDAPLWKSLADSDLLGIALPESAGGAGMGMLALVALLEQQGRHVTNVPVWPVVASAGLPLTEFGTEAQIAEWIPGLIDGSVIVTGALETGYGELPVLAEAAGDGYTLTGQITSVPAGDLAAAVLVPARTATGETIVAIVRTDAAGVTRTPLQVTSYEATASVDLAGVSVSAGDVLPGDGAQILSWTLSRARVALSALAIGVTAAALEQTATYTSEREQFGRPLSTNQAVAVRAADTYLDSESIRLTTQRAAWLMDLGKDDHEVDTAALVAKFWASRGGLRAVHATQHLHGGMGADIDYPIHRYFLWGRQIAFSLGSAGRIGAELGDALARGASIGSPE